MHLWSLPESQTGRVTDGGHPMAFLGDPAALRTSGIHHGMPVAPPRELGEFQRTGHALKRVDELAFPRPVREFLD